MSEKNGQVIISNGVVRKNGKILMVKRKREWDEQAHGKWELPGGKVEFGEKPKETVVREIKEETGFKTREPELIPETYTHLWEYENRKTHLVILSYTCRLDGGSKDCSDKNVMDVEWLSMEEIRNKDCLPGTMEIIKKV